MSRIHISMETESILVVAWSWERMGENKESLLKSMRFIFDVMKIF